MRNNLKKDIFLEKIRLIFYSAIFITVVFLNSLKIDLVTSYITDRVFSISASGLYSHRFILSFMLILVVFTLLLRLKSRIFLIIFYLIQNIYLLTHFIYNLYSGSFFHFRQFFLQFSEGLNLIYHLAVPFNLKCLIVFIDLPIILLILLKFTKFSELSHKKHKLSGLFVLLIFVLLIVNIANQMICDIKSPYDGEYRIIKKYGLLCNDVIDLSFYRNEEALIKKFDYGKRMAIHSEEKLKGQPQNIICIQVETLDPNIIHREYKDKYITPFLHTLSKQCIYYPYMVNLNFAGGSSDVEFAVFNNVVPLENFPSLKLKSYRYPNSIIKQLNNHGFNTKAFHGSDGWFYNRDVTYHKMGFQAFYDIDIMEEEKKEHGWGLRDGDLFSFVEGQMQNEDTPFFYYIITINSHQPYSDVEAWYLNEHYSDIKNKWTRDYFNSISYVDKELEDFVSFIKSRVKNCYIFIYGDHGAFMAEEDTTLFKRSYDTVSLFIITPDNAAYVEKKSVASLLDMGLTILNASGIDFDIYTYGDNLLDYPIKESTVFTKGGLEKRTSQFDEFEKEYKNLDLL
ncbi:MAG: LTA synthase family protein [Candidatus Gorgyraea atricola]|nr:LTA synthase family protein [Candidatus Gorgyraea atricola]